MKKIKSINQLKHEKKLLLKSRAKLERTIRGDWDDAKKSFKPKNIAGSMFNFFPEKERNGSDIFSDGLSFFAAKFTKRIIENAQQKIKGFFSCRIKAFWRSLHFLYKS